MRPAALAIDLRSNADWAFANRRQKLVLGIALCLPVPVLATSGLAMPLPSTVYRAAVALVGQTQALAGALAPLAPRVTFGASGTASAEFVADTPRSARRSSPSAETAPTARGARTDGIASRKHSSTGASRRPSVRTFAGTAAPADARAPKRDRAKPATRLIEFTGGPAKTTSPAAGSEERGGAAPHQPARNHPPAPEAPPTTRSDLQKQDPEPRDEAPTSKDEPRKPSPPGGTDHPTSPVTAVPLEPVVVVPPGEDLPVALPQAKSAREVLQALIDDYAGIAVTGKAKQALDSLRRAEQSLGHTPPNRRDAMTQLETAAGQVEGAVNDGLLTQAQGNDMLSRIANVGRLIAEAEIAEAKARSGDPTRIADAELKLARGDSELLLGQYRSALGRYKDALNRADAA